MTSTWRDAKNGMRAVVSGVSPAAGTAASTVAAKPRRLTSPAERSIHLCNLS